ncbi:DENN domain-containing protein 10 [Geodia barretti]|uniref:DENN domain-containing protein 10 n=1 Tax=Geodia barretti TaxID=519541 RepID=A0AA35TM52_GEOBA|nr:DENN domain-containing protein 10 [Geodia barretti]
MATSPPLESVHLLEKDTSGELLWVWSFPSIIPGLRGLITSRCTIPPGEGKEGEGEGEGGLPFSFGHAGVTWYYLANFSTGDAKTLPRVTTFCVIVLAKDFNPEKYQQLCGIFAAAYLSGGSPVSIVPHFLSVFTRGEITQPPVSCRPFSVRDHDIRKAYVACSFKGLVQQFGLESILIYTAAVLKKRIVVYASSLDSLLRTCRTIPLFVWHRQNWNVVFPQLSLEHKGEMEDLAKHSTYIAGFLDPLCPGSDRPLRPSHQRS